jgi:hypothetical protein
MTKTASPVDLILSTLNAADRGSLESLADKFQEVRSELADMDQPELAKRAAEAVEALKRGDIAEFQRGRAFLQSKVGHLRHSY